MQNHRNSIEIDNNKNQWLQSGISISFVRKSMFDEERKKVHTNISSTFPISIPYSFCHWCEKRNGFVKAETLIPEFYHQKKKCGNFLRSDTVFISCHVDFILYSIQFINHARILTVPDCFQQKKTYSGWTYWRRRKL